MPRQMEITTPLGDDVLLFHTMHAREELGRMSEYQLELLSEDPAIRFADILGKDVTVKLELPDESTRYFHGMCSRFAAGGKTGRYYRYFAVVHPWPWMMTRSADCRIFQEMTVPDIIKQVFNDYAADVKFELTGKYRKWIYCVQYRETDFNFISRLMEHEGIFYYFTHRDGHHTMMVVDSPGKHEPFPGYEEIRYIDPTQFVRPETEYIHQWNVAHEMLPEKFALTDYNFETPSAPMDTERLLDPDVKVKWGEMFDYPGFYMKQPDGQTYVNLRSEESASQYEFAQGATNARGLAVGRKFKLKTPKREDQEIDHVVVAATWDLKFSDYEAMPEHDAPSYSCTFTCIPHRRTFRPRRMTPKPFVQGPQTAVVVGPPGEEIHTDEFGRVKVQFFWDREGNNDAESSCWIRVSHPWAGKNYGVIHIPRVGQEVIVDFLEGDPDQPIITGRVYNAEQMPPYALPANKTQSGILTRSSQGGTPANANEIRFEDKKGQEQLYIHAEKNQDISVENNETHSVGANRTKTIGHDEKTHVKHDRTETVDNDEKITIKGNREETVDKNETITIHGKREETVDKDETITIHGSQSSTVDGTMSLTVKQAKNELVYLASSEEVGLARNLTVGAAYTIEVVGAMNTAVGGAMMTEIGLHHYETVGRDRSLNVGKKLTVDATDEVEIKSGGAVVTLKKDGKITINGSDQIELKSGAAAITMKSDGKIEIAGVDVTMKSGAGKVQIDPAGIIDIKGPMVKINT